MNSPKPIRAHATLALFAIMAVTFVAYMPATSCGYIWDDDDYVTQNETLRSTEGLRRIWFEFGATYQYYPLVHTSFWIEYQLWNLSPVGYHTTNILLHALSAFLLGRLLERLKVPGAWLAAAIFALHPVHVESVAWITERKNTLSALFYLLSTTCFFHFLESKQPEKNQARRWYVASIVLFACALCSKTVTVTLPAALLLIRWWQNGTISRRDLALVSPMLLLAVPFGVITVMMERYTVGTQHIDLGLSVVERFLVAGRAIWFYAMKLVWPQDLIFIYPRWQVSDVVWWQYLFPVAFFSVVGALWGFRKQLGRGPLAAVLFFAGTLAPALGFVDVYPMRFSFVADHFQYLASIGIIVLVSATFASRAKLSGNREIVFASPVLLCFAVLTWSQCSIYRDAETLWADTAERNPDALIAHRNLGIEKLEKNDYDAAIDSFSTAVEMDATVENYMCRATAYRIIREFDLALEDYSTIIELDEKNAEAFFHRGQIYNERWDIPNALKDYRKSLELDPQNAHAQFALKMLEAQIKDQLKKRP